VRDEGQGRGRGQRGKSSCGSQVHKGQGQFYLNIVEQAQYISQGIGAI
jgi:hypothetical protein